MAAPLTTLLLLLAITLTSSRPQFGWLELVDNVLEETGLDEVVEGSLINAIEIADIVLTGTVLDEVENLVDNAVNTVENVLEETGLDEVVEGSLINAIEIADIVLTGTVLDEVENLVDNAVNTVENVVDTAKESVQDLVKDQVKDSVHNAVLDGLNSVIDTTYWTATLTIFKLPSFVPSSLSFLFPLTLPLPIPSVMINFVTEMFKLLGLTEYLALSRDLLPSTTYLLSLLAVSLLGPVAIILGGATATATATAVAAVFHQFLGFA